MNCSFKSEDENSETICGVTEAYLQTRVETSENPASPLRVTRQQVPAPHCASSNAANSCVGPVQLWFQADGRQRSVHLSQKREREKKRSHIQIQCGGQRLLA